MLSVKAVRTRGSCGCRSNGLEQHGSWNRGAPTPLIWRFEEVPPSVSYSGALMFLFSLGHAPSFWAEGRPGDGIMPACCFASTSISAASIQSCLNLAISSSWAILIVSFRVAKYFFNI